MKSHSFAFKREYRLTESSAFEAVFNQACRAKSKYFNGYVCANSALGPRLGMAISKRSAKRAVDRNRLKRLIREYFRSQRQSFSSRDFIVLANAGAVSAPQEALEQSLAELFLKLCSVPVSEMDKTR